MITKDERRQILETFNDTTVDYPRDKTVIQLFEEQVRKTPDHVAVLFDDEQLTYKEFNAKVNVLAHKLRGLGVGRDDYVGIMTERSIEMIIGIYGIIKAGGAYVPLDPTYPVERIQYMLEDSNPKVVLTYQVEVETPIPVIDLGDLAVWEEACENPVHINQSSDLVYVIYTSGTTGKPKGVMNKHNGLTNLINWIQDEYPMTEDDTILQKTTYVFDVSASEMFWWSTVGAKLAVLKPGAEKDLSIMVEAIEKYEVSIINFVPSMLSMFTLYMAELNKQKIESLKYILAAGEVLTTINVANFYAAIEKYEMETKLGNIYGPTEASIYSTYYNCEKGITTVPIGSPISNTQVYIMNDEVLCGIGIPGELCIGGEGIARGYLNRPELTVEKFINNPYGEGRLYRTGDKARWLSDGNIEYLGRIDEQVKIRGYRIELGEIENIIRGLEEVKDCAVIARVDASGEKAIYAYMVSGNALSMAQIRDSLAKTLPEYMIPAYIMQIDAIPLMRNGKLDKRALPEIEAKTEQEYVAPRTEIEEKICVIFKEILGVDLVGIKDNFFDLGGHSLRATRLINRIELETGVRIPLKEVFASPTVEMLSEFTAKNEGIDYIPIPKAEKKEYYETSSAQKRIYLIQQMNLEAVTYNMPLYLRLTGEVRPERIEGALQELINRHEILRTAFIMLNGQLVQRIQEEVEIDFEYVNEVQKDEEQWMLAFAKPFDLGKASQLRARLIKMDDYYLLMLDMHHIISDGMSTGTFTNEFTELYNGNALAELTHQFKDYSEWMRNRDLSLQKDYWLSEFSDGGPVLDLPLDYMRPKERSFEGSMLQAETGEEIRGKIKALARKAGTTEYMIFLAAAMVLLGRLANQEDVVIGSPISGRTHKDTEQMLGIFINSLVMRGRPEKEKSFECLLEEVKATSLKAYENQEYPFEELVENIKVKRDPSRNPLFDVMLIQQNNEKIKFKGEGVLTESVRLPIRIAKYDLVFSIWENDKSYGIFLRYSTVLFKKETAERIFKHYVVLLKNLLERPNVKLKEISMITDVEQQ